MPYFLPNLFFFVNIHFGPKENNINFAFACYYFRAGINNLRSGCTVFLKEKKLEIKGEINKKKKKMNRG